LATVEDTPADAGLTVALSQAFVRYARAMDAPEGADADAEAEHAAELLAVECQRLVRKIDDLPRDQLPVGWETTLASRLAVAEETGRARGWAEAVAALEQVDGAYDGPMTGAAAHLRALVDEEPQPVDDAAVVSG